MKLDNSRPEGFTLTHNHIQIIHSVFDMAINSIIKGEAGHKPVEAQINAVDKLSQLRSSFRTMHMTTDESTMFELRKVVNDKGNDPLVDKCPRRPA